VFDLSHPKLKKLATLEGYDDASAFLIEACDDSVCPAICMNEGCDYVTGMEPDQVRELLRCTFGSNLICRGVR
jgi:hypothetical protein